MALQTIQRTQSRGMFGRKWRHTLDDNIVREFEQSSVLSSNFFFMYGHCSRSPRLTRLTGELLDSRSIFLSTKKTKISCWMIAIGKFKKLRRYILNWNKRSSYVTAGISIAGLGSSAALYMTIHQTRFETSWILWPRAVFTCCVTFDERHAHHPAKREKSTSAVRLYVMMTRVARRFSSWRHWSCTFPFISISS